MRSCSGSRFVVLLAGSMGKGRIQVEERGIESVFKRNMGVEKHDETADDKHLKRFFTLTIILPKNNHSAAVSTFKAYSS